MPDKEYDKHFVTQSTVSLRNPIVDIEAKIQGQRGRFTIKSSPAR